MPPLLLVLAIILPMLGMLSLRSHRITLRILSRTRVVPRDVGPVLDVLVEIADVAAYFMVGLEGEGDDGDEAECEPFPGEERGLARFFEKGEGRFGGKGMGFTSVYRRGRNDCRSFGIGRLGFRSLRGGR